MLRYSGKPGEKALAMAYVANVKGVGFYYFSPNDVIVSEKKIRAKKLINDRWVDEIIDYPCVIDNDTNSIRVVDVWNSLNNSCNMTTQILGGKLKTLNLLKDNNIFSEILIPQVVVRNYKDFISFLMKNKNVVLKPISGNQGRNIYFISILENIVNINFEGESRKIHTNELQDFYDSVVKGKNFIIQKFIKSQTAQGAPFDIRIHVQRNGLGEWETSKIYARISSGKKMTANLSGGGSMANAIQFLKALYGSKYTKPVNTLKKIANQLPELFQNFYVKEIDALGIDLGVDERGNVWLFEINSFPGSKYFEFERARVRIDYLIFLMNNFRNIKSGE